MAIEHERGISVSSAVMSFEHETLALNLLGMPGRAEFRQWDSSDDTRRPLNRTAQPHSPQPRGSRGSPPKEWRPIADQATLAVSALMALGSLIS
jgi:hypothetical protein